MARTQDGDPDGSILAEAHGLVHGARGDAYDHPAVDYGRAVDIFNAWTGLDLSAAEGVQFMVAVKLSRFVASPEIRDHLVDAAGYLECLRMVQDHDDDGT